jgi:hypothetical protein
MSISVVCALTVIPNPALNIYRLHKFDRSTYKHARDDVVIVSNSHIRVYGDAPKFKEKMMLPLADLTGLHCSNLSDGVCVISTPGIRGKEGIKGDKGMVLSLSLSLSLFLSSSLNPGTHINQCPFYGWLTGVGQLVLIRLECLVSARVCGIGWSVWYLAL